MNGYLLSASVLAFVVGLIHSVLGEILIFRRMRRGGFIPTDGGNVLRESNVRILWASWHVLTVFGWGMAILLLWLAQQSLVSGTFRVLENTVAASMLVGAVLILIGTKAKHPGWVGLLGVAVLVWFGGTH
ncbi:hypothetical protein BCM02_109347 [Paenibacillus methanolicus]|uniref:Uncharacterized protein n=1 Tax=Paenibacillus methanolicus TaxID=582686 RepID=A0A5S5C0D1_9BACL|nr:hypothetical protein BCM02_109347 [Paenibacillus methanolicus]